MTAIARRRLLIGGLTLVAVVAVVLVIRSWATNDEDRARAAVERYAADVAARDYAGICQDQFSDELRDKLQSFDAPCEQLLESGFRGVRNPRLSVTNVVVIKDRARVAIRTDAVGQPPSADVLSLEKQDGTWRISDLNQRAQAVSTGPAKGSGSATVPTPSTSTTQGAPSGVGDLTPDVEGLPDDSRIQDKKGTGKSVAEKRRDARTRALQRRAQRVQGARGDTP